MKRIVIIGTSCSGKSTLAKAMSERLNNPVIELDSLHWKPNWVERDAAEFLSLVEAAASKENWIMDGNYSIARDIIWPKATSIIWLDYSFPLVLYRAIARSTRRILTKQKLFSGNVESFQRAFLSKQSIIYWVIKTHKLKKERYSRLMDIECAAGRDVRVLRSPADTSRFLDTLAGTQGK